MQRQSLTIIIKGIVKDRVFEQQEAIAADLLAKNQAAQGAPRDDHFLELHDLPAAIGVCSNAANK